MSRTLRPVISRYQRAALIYNPHSGQLKRGRAHKLVRAAELLRDMANEVTLQATQGPRTAGALAAEAIEKGADLIIAAGGDGTISEVVDGMAYSHVPLGILPAGTANVLAHELHVPRNVVSAARLMPECCLERVSLGVIDLPSGERRHFLLMAGAGFDAQIVYELSGSLKDRLGKLSYFLGGLGRMGSRLEELEVSWNGSRVRCTFALISKVRNYGGDFEIAAEVQLRDSEFELVVFSGRSSWKYLWYLVGVATRRLKHYPGVSFARSGAVDVRPVGNCVRLQADGELIGPLPARITMAPSALTLLVPNAC